MKAKQAQQSLYEGRCTVTERQKTKKPNGSTGFAEVIIHEDLPCRLSFKSFPQTAPNDNLSSSMEQVTVLFIDPDIEIKAGSKITVTQNDITTDYTHSSVPAKYVTHQEIVLDLFEGWS